MKFSIRVCIAAIAMLGIASQAWAEGSVAAVIEYTSGDDVVVIRAGKRAVMQDPIGFELLQGDQIITGKDVFLELRIRSRSSSGNAIIKLAENTTFVLDAMSEGQTALRLVYGRVRAKVDRLTGGDTFSLRSSSVIAGVRGTDFGLDVLASKSAMSINASDAYCFDGTITVRTLGSPKVQSGESLEAVSQSFTLHTGEMLKVEQLQETTSAVKTGIDEEIRQFWVKNDYVIVDSADDRQALFDQGYAAGLLEAKSQLTIAEDFVPDGFVSKQEADAIRKASIVQKGGTVAGGMLGIGGAALAATGLYLTNTGDLEGGIVYLQSGAILSGLAIPFLLLSLFARP